MRLSLVVEGTGKSRGRVIPVTLSQFVIGRDPECHLRPASGQISKRHCALVVRGRAVYLRDFNSTNGTFLNDRQIRGEIELMDGDHLRIGPLTFLVRMEAAPSAGAPTPVPTSTVPHRTAEDELAALLLNVGGESDTSCEEGDEVPEGSTVMVVPAYAGAAAARNGMPDDEPVPAPRPKAAAAKPATADTSAAAKMILDKYLRRAR